MGCAPHLALAAALLAGCSDTRRPVKPGRPATQLPLTDSQAPRPCGECHATGDVSPKQFARLHLKRSGFPLNGHLQVGCIACHQSNDGAGGKRLDLRRGTARNGRCMACHMFVHEREFSDILEIDSRPRRNGKPTPHCLECHQGTASGRAP